MLKASGEDISLLLSQDGPGTSGAAAALATTSAVAAAAGPWPGQDMSMPGHSKPSWPGKMLDVSILVCVCVLG